MKEFVSPLAAVGLDDLARVGGKGANLGEMIRAGFPVPPGFSVKAKGFERFVDAARLQKPIDELASRIDFEDLKDLEEKTSRIREIISAAGFPEDLEKEVREAYEVLGEEEAEFPLVAVRSSAGTTDLLRSSFPGQMDTFCNVRGHEEVLDSIRECWASVWSARAAGSRHRLKIDPNRVVIAPLVQMMVPSEVSGVLFTANPINGDASEMLLEAAFGLGEPVVSGSLTPDHYDISKKALRVISSKIGCKSFKLELDARKGKGTRKVVLSEEEANRECLTTGQVRELAQVGIAVEGHFGTPQDIEWTYSGGKLFLVQSRRITGFAPGRES
jgi:pyruvate,water dikinase